MDGDRYLFIVGLPRTGTKLTRSILESSRRARIRLSPETWFLGDLFRSGIRSRIRRIGDMTEDGNVRSLVEEMYHGDIQRTFWRELRSGGLPVQKDALLKGLLASDRTDRAIYDVLLTVTAEARLGRNNGRNLVVGDKMPGNLYHVPTLVEWFPNARIVHTFRDPRAILASEWKRLMSRREPGLSRRITNPFYSMMVVLYVTITWLYAIRLHRKYSALFPRNYRLFKYEDLVEKPEDSVRELCEFIEIEFDERMLAPARKGSSFDQTGTTGFDRDAVSRWKTQLKPWMRTWLAFWGGRSMKEFGYQR